MKRYLALLWPCLALASDPGPTPFPVFLKQGFSSVLEFDEAPSRIVLGDGNSFQVEKLERSLVIRTLSSYAVSNLFVYFEKQNPRLFVLTASEDAEPTFFKNFEKPQVPKLIQSTTTTTPRNRSAATSRILGTRFDDHKDYLSVLVEIVADSKNVIQPKWNLVRLTFKGVSIAPHKLWAERKEIQRDTKAKARFLFVKPNLPKNLTGSRLVIPVSGSETPISLNIYGVLK